MAEPIETPNARRLAWAQETTHGNDANAQWANGAIGASWRIRLNDPRSAAIRPYVELLCRKGIWPVKKLSGGVLAWLFVWSDV